jgi:protein-S-isoprenylcysteine O-methyltransferase Ste14
MRARAADGQEPPRDHAAVRIFPPAIPLLAILAGYGLQKLWPLRLGLPVASNLRELVGWGIVALAVLGFGFPAVFLFRRSGQEENPWKPTTSIVERGPYRLTRNPMYVQMLLICLGFAILLANPWIALLTPVAGWALQRLVIVHEEAYLEGKFGDVYVDYKRRVRRWF